MGSEIRAELQAPKIENYLRINGHAWNDCIFTSNEAASGQITFENREWTPKLDELLKKIVKVQMTEH